MPPSLAASDSTQRDFPNVVEAGDGPLTQERLAEILSSSVARPPPVVASNSMSPRLLPPPSPAIAPAPFPVSRTSPRRSSNLAAPVPAGTPKHSTTNAASPWSAAAWSEGAPPSVHSSQAPKPLRGPSVTAATASSASKVAEQPPRPRSGIPQAWDGSPTANGGAGVTSDARAAAAAYGAAAHVAALRASPPPPMPYTVLAQPAAFAGGGGGAGAGRGGTQLEVPMAPPRETPREKRLQQQRDALSHAVAIAQTSASEAAVRAELFRRELLSAEEMGTRLLAVLAGVHAERASLRSQFDALGAELRIARQANERLTVERLAGGMPAHAIVSRPSSAASNAGSTGGGRGRGPASAIGGRGRGPIPSGTSRSASPAPPSDRRLAVAGDARYGAPVPGEPAHPSATTQTWDEDESDPLGGATARAASAEFAGMRAEVVQLREQIATMTAKRQQELEMGERSHVAAMAAHGTSALHARLLWSEAHSLEEALADATASLAKERRVHAAAIAQRDADIVELRAAMSQQDATFQQQLSRARADRRVLSRNSRDFLDSKKTVEAQRDALEEQLAAAEERQQALLREQKEKAKLVKEAAHYRNEMELRLATLEKSLFDARKEKKATELSAEKAQAQGRADREVLVECVRQMASQLATARAAAEAANAQLLQSADEATRRVRAAEAIVGSESHELSRLRAQLGECERQLHNEVENRHGSDLAHEAQVLRAAHREEELERQLKAAESVAASQEANLDAARREAEAQLAATRQSERAREEAATLARMELSELQSEMRLAERQVELAQQRRAEAEAAQGRIEAVVVRLEAEAVERSSQLAQLAHEHGSLHRAHTTLLAEAAMKTQLLNEMGESARLAQIAADINYAALRTDVATSEAQAQATVSERQVALSELRAERSEHEACRLQLGLSQTALQRTRTEANQSLAAESVRLMLVLDELRRADRLAGVIHRSLNDAVRGSADAHLLLRDAAPPTYPAAPYAPQGGAYLPSIASSRARSEASLSRPISPQRQAWAPQHAPAAPPATTSLIALAEQRAASVASGDCSSPSGFAGAVASAGFDATGPSVGSSMLASRAESAAGFAPTTVPNPSSSLAGAVLGNAPVAGAPIRTGTASAPTVTPHTSRRSPLQLITPFSASVGATSPVGDARANRPLGLSSSVGAASPVGAAVGAMAAAAAERAVRQTVGLLGGRGADVGAASISGFLSGRSAEAGGASLRGYGVGGRTTDMGAEVGGGGESVGSPPAFPSRSRPLSGAERLAELAAGLDEIGLARSSARSSRPISATPGSSRPISATPQAPPSEAGGSEADGPGLVGGACGGGQLDSGGLASSIAFGRLGGSLDVRGEGTSVGTSFAGLSESLGWLKSDSHQDRLRRLREKYGYDQ